MSSIGGSHFLHPQTQFRSTQDGFLGGSSVETAGGTDVGAGTLGGGVIVLCSDDVVVVVVAVEPSLVVPS